MDFFLCAVFISASKLTCESPNTLCGDDFARVHFCSPDARIGSFQGEDIRGLEVKVLEELQNFHVEALSRICQEKVLFSIIHISFLLNFLNFPPDAESYMSAFFF